MSALREVKRWLGLVLALVSRCGEGAGGEDGGEGGDEFEGELGSEAELASELELESESESELESDFEPESDSEPEPEPDSEPEPESDSDLESESEPECESVSDCRSTLLNPNSSLPSSFITDADSATLPLLPAPRRRRRMFSGVWDKTALIPPSSSLKAWS